MLVAITREVSLAIGRCELTHLRRETIDVERVRAEQRAYEAALAVAGCRVERLEAGPDMPDSVFVEDTAIVFDELAILARPGAESRRTETPAVATALRRYRPLCTIEAPGTVDGGDVLVVGRRVFVGRSRRTNEAGIDQMQCALEPHGYQVEPVDVSHCLHLKSAVTAVGDGLLLTNPAWVPPGPFRSFDRIEVHPDEPWAANALWVGDGVIYPAAWPRTGERLETRGVKVCTVEASELAKAEGAVTCCSLILETKTD
ncbi:MAG: dimethylargininase [Acidobacteria bacterium RIFCSPLOWO2_12_FULL_65_11]|nr:MAG: dimethylargininase [Acidobacteria bacterium RIFCSPLOWO2_02_FULL_64_15]OFW33303.1 MAG: dimethylargininase [Acidobacteria bacterium RIFCSPLOWO2_12_FULL_65_11]